MSMFSDAIINIWLNTGDAKKQLDGLQGAFAKTADKIQNNFIAKLGGLALGGVGIKGLTNVYDEALKIQNLAESWNLPVEKVSAFTNAFSLLGGSTDDALGAIDKLQNLSNQLKFDSSGALRELSAVIGTNLFNKDYQGAIDALRQNFGALNTDAQKKVVDMLGIDNLPFLRMLKQSDEEYEETNKKAQEFGVLTEKTTQSLRSMEISLSTIRQAFQAVSYSVLEKLAPVLDKISAGMERVALSPEVKTGIVGILGAVTLLWQNWDKVSQAFKDYLAESPRLQQFIAGTKELFSDLAGVIKDLYDWVVENFDVFIEFFKGAGEIYEKIIGGINDGGAWLGDKFADLMGWGKRSGPIEYIPQLNAPNYQPSLAQTRINNAATNDNSRNSTVNVGSVVLPNVSDSRQFAREMERMGNRGLPSVAQNNAGGVML